MPIPAFDPKNGSPISVPEETAADLYRTGKIAFKAGTQVPVRGRDGSFGTIDVGQLGAALDQGVSIAMPQEYRKAELEATYGDIGSALKAGAAGLGRGLTLGASDPAALMASEFIGGKEAREKLRTQLSDIKETYPATSLATEVVGSLAPLAVSGGGSAVAEAGTLAARAASAARFAGAAPRALVKLGGLAETGASRLIAEKAATTLAGRIAQKAIPQAARAAVETAGFGVGQEISEAALGNHELTGEHVFARVARDMLLGAGLGAGLASISTVAESVLARRATQAVDGIEKAGGISGALTKFADESAFKAAGATKRTYKDTLKLLGEDGVENIGRAIREETPKVAGKSFGSMTEEEIWQAAKTLKGQSGGVVGESYAVLDRGPGLVRPSMKRLIGRIDSEVIASAAAIPGQRNVVAALKDYVDDLAEKSGLIRDEAGKIVLEADIGFEQLHQFNVALGHQIYKGTQIQTPSIIVSEMRQIKRLISDELKTAGSEAAKAAGLPTWLEDLEKANKTYGTFSAVEKMAADHIAATKANRFISPSDYGVGGLVGAAGSIIRGGIDPVSIAMGLGSSLVHKVIRERGRMVAADVADRMSRIGAVSRASQEMDQKVADGVKGFIAGRSLVNEPTLSAKFISAKLGSPDKIEHVVDTLTQQFVSPQAMQEKGQRVLGNLHEVAPSVNRNAMDTMGRAVKFLQSKAPKMIDVDSTLTPHIKRHKYSDAELSKFARYYTAVTNPTSVLDDMRRGRLNGESVEALRKVYPRLYEQIQMRMLDQLSQLKGPLNYTQKLQAKVLLGVASDPTLRVEFVNQMQESYAPVTAQQSPRQPTGQAPNIAGAFSTEPQRTEAGDL